MIKVGDRVTYLDPQLQAYIGVVSDFCAHLTGFVIVEWVAPTVICARERASNLLKINEQ